MHPSDLLTLHAFHDWATDRLLERAEQLNESEYHAPHGGAHPSLHAIFVHLLAAEQVWRLRCQGDSPTTLLSEAEIPTRAALVEQWRAERTAWRDFLATLPTDGFDRTVRYANTKGTLFKQPLWEVLLHVSHHAMQHRSEIAMHLTALGHSPGDLDLIAFLRQREGQGST